MTLEKTFKYVIGLKAFMLLLIITWGAYIKSTEPITSGEILIRSQGITGFADISELFFVLFSITYFVSSYLLLKFEAFGKKLFLLSIITFIIFGFFSEITNPLEAPKDIIYFFIFYIIFFGCS